MKSRCCRRAAISRWGLLGRGARYVKYVSKWSLNDSIEEWVKIISFQLIKSQFVMVKSFHGCCLVIQPRKMEHGLFVDVFTIFFYWFLPIQNDAIFHRKFLDDQVEGDFVELEGIQSVVLEMKQEVLPGDFGVSPFFHHCSTIFMGSQWIIDQTWGQKRSSTWGNKIRSRRGIYSTKWLI